MDNYTFNPVKQNIRVKQFTGWFIAIFFPFTLKEIMRFSKSPFLSCIIYWVVGGIILRLVIDKRLPYLKIHFKKVKKETIILFIANFIAIYLLIISFKGNYIISRDIVYNFFFFGIIDGIFEQLVWINIFDLAGSRKKILGFMAVLVYVILIYKIFWFAFLPVINLNMPIFYILQLVIFVEPLFIYLKTSDITIWSIQHMLYNVIIVIITNFGFSSFFYLH